MMEMSAAIRLPLAIAMVTVILLILPAFPEKASAQDLGEENSSWTFIVYMSADVPGSPLSWQDDLNELEAGLLSQDIEIFCLVDPEGEGDSRIYSVVHDGSESDEIVSEEIGDVAFIQETGEVNMGDPQTLIDFAGFIIEDRYSDGRFGIIFWGHGEGIYGVSLDRGDYLDLAELRSSLSTIRDMLDKEIDLLVFDACSMGSLEAMSQLVGTAEYAVSSEIDVASYGLPYDSIFTRLSVNPSLSNADIGSVFADEHIKYGALITGISSHAAVIDLDMLGEAGSGFMAFSDCSRRFIPIVKEEIIEARSSSCSIDAINTVDLISYMDYLTLSDTIPRRLLDSAVSNLGELNEAVVSNHAYINISDAMSGLSPSGLSIFYPVHMVPGDSYENISDTTKAWTAFIRELVLGENSEIIEMNISLSMTDGRFGDGLNDTVVFTWSENSVIDIIDFDVFREHDNVLVENCSEQIEYGGLSIYWLDPDIYEFHVYCLDPNESYRNYFSFESISIFREFVYRVSLTGLYSGKSLDIVLFNLDSGTIERAVALGDEAVIRVTVPDIYRLGDRVLVQILADGKILASGMIVVGDDFDTEVQMTTGRSMSSLLEYSCTLLLTALIIFSFIKIMRIGEGTRWKIRGIRNQRK